MKKGEDDSSFMLRKGTYIPTTRVQFTFQKSTTESKSNTLYFCAASCLSLGFVGECSASSTFLTDAASSGSMLSAHRTARLDTAYIYMLYVLLRGEENVFLHPCYQEQHAKDSEKGIKCHCKTGTN